MFWLNKSIKIFKRLKTWKIINQLALCISFSFIQIFGFQDIVVQGEIILLLLLINIKFQ